MDPLTHTLTGLAIARSGLSQRHGRGTTLLLVIAANAPDIDALILLQADPCAHALRRMATHSLLGLTAMALGVALLFKWKYKDRGLASLFGLALLGTASHSFLDLINSYGVVLLHPFSQQRFELAWTFIIDIAIWVILLAPSVIRALRPKQRAAPGPWRLSLVLLAAYLALCSFGHWRAERMLVDATQRAGLSPSFTHVFPEALGPHRFRGVALDGATWHAYLHHVWSGETDTLASVPTSLDTAEVRAVLATRDGQVLDWFFMAPTWDVSADGREVSVHDLRFASTVLERRGLPFLYRFDIHDGQASRAHR